MFEGRLPSFANTRSMRVAVAWGPWPEWSATPRKSTTSASRSTMVRPIESLYKPYHRALRRLFTHLHREFGAAVLIDCHSMPSTAGHRDERPRPEFVLGDRYGTSCVGVVAETVEKTLRALGYTVSRNKPYAGGFITEHYGNPASDCMPSSLRSTAPFIWTSAVISVRRHSDRLAADMETLAMRRGEIPLAAAAALPGRCRIAGPTKKRPLARASGPS